MGRKKNKTRQAAEKPRPTGWDRRLLFILAIGICARIAYDASLTDNPFFGNYILDSLVLHQWAVDIMNGAASALAYFRAPLYPYLLAFLYKLFGVTPWAAVLFQNLLGLATAVVVYRFARELFSPKLAFIAGIITVVYPTLVYFEGETMITTLAVFLYTLSVYFMWRAVERGGVNTVFAGVVLGLAAITRPTILPLAILFPVALIFRHGWSDLTLQLKRTALFALFVLIPILPVSFRNLVIGSEPVLISTQGGVNLYIGNSADADGITVISPGPNLRIGKYSDNIWTASMDEAERLTGKKLSQSEVSSFWMDKASEWIFANPLAAAKLFLKKFYLFWHGQEIFNNKSLYFAGNYSLFMRVFLWKYVLNFPSGLLFPLTIVGMFLAAFSRRSAILVPAAYIVGFAVLVSIFFVCSRFRQPIVPLATIFAVYAVMRFIESVKEKKWSGYAGIASFVILAVLLNLGGNVESAINESQFHATLGTTYLSQKDYKKGIPELEQSLKILPDNLQIYEFLGNAYYDVNQMDRAEATFAEGIKRFPSYPTFNFGMGRVAQAKGEYSKAKEYYGRTLEHAPKFAAALDRLGYIYTKEQKPDSALFYYEKLLLLDQSNRSLRQRVESLRQQVNK